MRPIAFFAILLASTLILASCATVSSSAMPAQATEQPTATLIAEATAPKPAPTATITLPLNPPPGLTLSNPAEFNIAVEHPQMTITLVGLEVPAGFPPATPDAGQRFVAPQLAFFCLLPVDAACPSIGSFELIDSQGTRHSPSIAVAGEGFLPAGEFPGGTTITGGMVFMVPVEATPMILRYVGLRGREAFFRIE